MLKKIVTGLTVLIAGLGVQGATLAQNYPSRPITMIMPVAPNVAYYHLLRLMSDNIQGRTGATIVFDQVLGANGTLAASRVKRSEPDGQTLGLTFASIMTMEPLLRKERPYDPIKDFSYITMLTQHGIVFLAGSGFGPNNLAETIAYAKANPEKVKAAVPTTAGRIGLNQIEDAAGIKFFMVPYKASNQAETAILAGEVDLYFQSAGTAVGLVKGGRMKALFIGSKKRSALFPNLGTISEALPKADIEVGSWFGLYGPGGMPADRVNWHVREYGAAIRDPKISEMLEKQQGFEVVMLSPQQFVDQVRRELEANQRTITKYNIGSE